jgi:hypothetical protein
MAWVVIVVVAKALKFEKYGFEIKAYSLVYKNKGVNSVLLKILNRTRRGIRVFADTSVIAGFIMMAFAFWFLLNNVSNFFVAQSEFSELTVLIPGVTLTSASSITYFLLSIPIVLVIHEGAHGIVAALEKIKIKTGGFAIFIAMFAGFVDFKIKSHRSRSYIKCNVCFCIRSYFINKSIFCHGITRTTSKYIL